MQPQGGVRLERLRALVAALRTLAAVPAAHMILQHALRSERRRAPVAAEAPLRLVHGMPVVPEAAGRREAALTVGTVERDGGDDVSLSNGWPLRRQR